MVVRTIRENDVTWFRRRMVSVSWFTFNVSSVHIRNLPTFYLSEK